jgi:hypothetical protein
MPPARIGEVIEAGTSKFTAECYELHSPPDLGSLVRTIDGELEVYGVICGAATQGTDPGRRLIARGRDEPDEESIYRQNPQLTKLLRTTFDALVIGHRSGDEVRHYLPPRPARVHSFVYVCEQEDSRRFTQSFDFLATLLGTGQGIADEVVSACLRQASHAHEDRRKFLVNAGKELSVLLSGDLNRLNSILRRIKP